MSTQNNQDQEIDLSLLSKKIGSFFESINTSIFKGILFVKRNIIVFGVLFILGAGLGYFLDKTSASYDSEIIVSPNFGSVDYLYGKINLLDSKIKSKDSLFLKSIGIVKPKDISLIEIKPVVDIYSFVASDSKTSVTNAQNSQNFELLKLLSEDGDIKKVIADELTSKNYNHHKIKITTDSKSSTQKIVDSILSYLDKTNYYQNLRVSYVENFKSKIKSNTETVKQIDGLLNQFITTNSSSSKSNNLVYYNENTQLNDVIRTKDELIKENNTTTTDLLNLDKVIKERSRIINVKDNKGANNKMKFILPFVFIAIFIFYGLFMAFYRNQSAKISKT